MSYPNLSALCSFHFCFSASLSSDLRIWLSSHVRYHLILLTDMNPTVSVYRSKATPKKKKKKTGCIWPLACSIFISKSKRQNRWVFLQFRYTNSVNRNISENKQTCFVFMFGNHFLKLLRDQNGRGLMGHISSQFSFGIRCCPCGVRKRQNSAGTSWSDSRRKTVRALCACTDLLSNAQLLEVVNGDTYSNK